MANHRAPVNRTGRKRGSVLASSVIALVLALGIPAQAHNHAANPSGMCNADAPSSPGNSGEGPLNPAGKLVAKANADKAQGDENCDK